MPEKVLERGRSGHLKYGESGRCPERSPHSRFPPWPHGVSPRPRPPTPAPAARSPRPAQASQFGRLELPSVARPKPSVGSLGPHPLVALAAGHGAPQDGGGGVLLSPLRSTLGLRAGRLGMTVAPDGRTLAWLCGRLTGLDRRAAVTETLGTSSLLLECLCSLPLVGPTGRAGGPCPFCLSVSCLVPYAPSGICCCSGILEPDTGRNGSLQVSVDTPVHMDRKRGS